MKQILVKVTLSKEELPGSFIYYTKDKGKLYKKIDLVDIGVNKKVKEGLLEYRKRVRKRGQSYNKFENRRLYTLL
tara:strand:+ start:674 stop:898 length:225 start_codon:yes stop_codon:yes gene_type:complete